jgi:hypothetical protein
MAVFLGSVPVPVASAAPPRAQASCRRHKKAKKAKFKPGKYKVHKFKKLKKGKVRVRPAHKAS